MSCRSMLCQECATQWDGIWHCAKCLAARRGTRDERSSVPGWIGVSVLSLVFLYLGARTLVWAAALIAGLF